MSNTTKVVIIVVIVLAVAGGLWWWSMSSNNGNNAAAANGTSSAMGTAMASPTPAPAADDSDQAIQQDMAAMNGSISAFSSDSASVDQGLNDQPVQQAQ